jgi:hypothetical protein
VRIRASASRMHAYEGLAAEKIRAWRSPRTSRAKRILHATSVNSVQTEEANMSLLQNKILALNESCTYTYLLQVDHPGKEIVRSPVSGGLRAEDRIEEPSFEKNP